MISLFVVAAALICIAHGDTMHHFRHHGLTEILRERLGLTPAENSMDGNTQPVMLLPELSKVLSSLHERHSERVARRLMMSSLNQDNHDNEQKENKAVRDGNQDEAYQRLMTLALNHLLKNLQTVEGGTEAMNWISAMRTGTTPKTPTQLYRLQTDKQSVASSTDRSVFADDSENEAIPK